MERKGQFLGLNIYQVVILLLVFVIIIGLILFFFVSGEGGFMGEGSRWVSETITSGFKKIFG